LSVKASDSTGSISDRRLPQWSQNVWPFLHPAVLGNGLASPVSVAAEHWSRQHKVFSGQLEGSTIYAHLPKSAIMEAGAAIMIADPICPEQNY
jgi:hypothetical protein